MFGFYFAQSKHCLDYCWNKSEKKGSILELFYEEMNEKSKYRKHFFFYSNLKRIIQMKGMTCEVFLFFIEKIDVMYVNSKNYKQDKSKVKDLFTCMINIQNICCACMILKSQVYHHVLSWTQNNTRLPLILLCDCIRI